MTSAISIIIGYFLGIIVATFIFPLRKRLDKKPTTDITLRNQKTGKEKTIRITGTGTMATIVDMTPDVDLGDTHQ